MNLIPESQSYQLLVDAIGSALNEARIKAVASVNTLLVQTNWEIGQYIVEFEQKGNDRAKYGDELTVYFGDTYCLYRLDGDARRNFQRTARILSKKSRKRNFTLREKVFLSLYL